MNPDTIRHAFATFMGMPADTSTPPVCGATLTSAYDGRNRPDCPRCGAILDAARAAGDARGTYHEAALLAYHLSCMFRETGKLSMQVHARMPIADVVITPANLSPEDQHWGNAWDQVVINGHHCGNRNGGARAYARLTAGDPDWYRAR